MTGVVLLLVAVAGGVGAACRYVLDSAISHRFRTALPLGTLVINLTGSLVLGALTGLAGTGALASPVLLVVGTGLVGGYTTFSTASTQVADLLAARRSRLAVATAAGMALGATALAGIGFAVASAIA